MKNLHVDSKPFYELLRDDVPLNWTKEHEKLLQNNKNRLSEETIFALPNPKYPFHFMLTHPALLLDSSWYKSLQVENV